MKVIQQINFENIKYWKLGYHPFQNPTLFVHCFLVDGLLIDTGFSHISKDLVGISKEESIHKIIVTHHHEDHAGNVEALKNSLGIEAYGSEKCVELMKNPPRVEPARIITWGQQKKAKIVALNLSEKIETNKFSFQIMETPGHAADQICLYEANKGWLFSADTYLNDHIQIFMRDEKIEAHIQTLKKILKLDFEVLFCSHNVKLKNGKSNIANKLQFLEDFYGRVKEEYMRGLSEKSIMKTLKIKEYRMIKMLSMGQLSRLNMIRSAISAIQAEEIETHKIRKSEG